jgi:uncharacterized protein
VELYILLFLIVGCVAGLLSGGLGVGGAVFVVPALVFIFHLGGMPNNFIMHIAIGTSLAAMVVTTCSSLCAHHRQLNISWIIFLQLLPGLIMGALFGALLSAHLSTIMLKIIFGIFLLFIAFHLFLSPKLNSTCQLPKWPGKTLIGSLVGMKAGLLGAGCGIMLVPFLTYCNVPIRKASGTALACTLPIAFMGALSFIFAGRYITNIAYSSGYVYWPAFFGIITTSVIFAPIGSYLADRIDAKKLKQLFAIFLLIVGLKWIFSSIGL